MRARRPPPKERKHAPERRISRSPTRRRPRARKSAVRRPAARRPGNASDLTRFRALGEAGARNAATALGQILGRPLRLSLSWVRLVPLEKLNGLTGGSARVVCALSLKVHGEARGSLLVVFPREQLSILLDLLLPSEHSGRSRAPRDGRLDDMERSALMEMGNILGCAYLNALSRLLGVSLRPSIPGLAVDMVGAVTDHLLIELAAVCDSTVVLATQVKEPASGLVGSIFFLPHPTALAILGRLQARPEPTGAAGF